MQLEPWPDDLVDVTDNDQCDAFDPAVNGNQVHAIQRRIGQPGQTAFQCHPSTDQIPHQAADRGKAAERDQRASVSVYEIDQWFFIDQA